MRNVLYDAGILKSYKFDVPVISIGNLTVGGTGKSPMTEYLVQLLQDRYKIAILSRGYGRKSRGFYEVQPGSSVTDAGDEPLQIKNKFPTVTVAVCENRVNGIKNLQNDYDVIILDDAYQHRAVKPGLSVLLMDYSGLLKWQWLLPTGDLREPFSGRDRADYIVITKTPVDQSDSERHRITEEIQLSKKQGVFFSYIEYGELLSVCGAAIRPLSSIKSDTMVLLLTGIAKPALLVNQIRKYTKNIHHHCYPDHHSFTPKNISKIAKDFNNSDKGDKIIITTEKDLQRLKSPDTKELLYELPVYYLPVKAAMHTSDKGEFDRLIMNYVTTNTRNN